MRFFGAVWAICWSLFAAVLLPLHAAALAADGAPAFVVEAPLLKYSLLASKNGDAGTVYTSKVATVPISDAYLAFVTGLGQIVYVFPFVDAKAFAVGHFVTPEIEAGMLLGFNSSTNHEEKDERDTFGIFTRWHKPLGAHKLELWGTVAMNDAKARRSRDKQADLKGDLSYASVDIDANYIIPLSPHVKYVAGLKYKVIEGRDHIAYARIAQSELEVKVLSLRAVLD